MTVNVSDQGRASTNPPHIRVALTLPPVFKPTLDLVPRRFLPYIPVSPEDNSSFRWRVKALRIREHLHLTRFVKLSSNRALNLSLRVAPLPFQRGISAAGRRPY